MTLVGKMALAIGRETWGGEVIPQGKWTDAARAALAVVIAEMREPSKVAVEEGWKWLPDHDPGSEDVRKAWRAMLDQFEKEHTGG